MNMQAWTFQIFQISYTKNVVKVHALRWQNRLPYGLGDNSMGYIHCCGALHRTKTFRLVPQDKFMLCEVDYLSRCPVCGHTVVQLTRIDNNDNISVVRKTNKKAKEFLAKLKNKVLYEIRPINYNKTNCGKFYLNYNEFGVKKRCYSNLRTLKMGLTENKYLKI